MSDEAPAVLGIAALAVDCADPPGLARWWARLLGGTVTDHADGDATLHAPGLDIDFFTVPEPKTIKNRLHLDVRASSRSAATEQAEALGATRADDVYDGGEWQVLRDPEGNEFCVIGRNA
jgi:catechol 2,3-dioxygenase-like lactoylglutathione lyase family enzyme